VRAPTTSSTPVCREREIGKVCGERAGIVYHQFHPKESDWYVSIDMCRCLNFHSLTYKIIFFVQTRDWPVEAVVGSKSDPDKYLLKFLPSVYKVSDWVGQIRKLAVDRKWLFKETLHLDSSVTILWDNAWTDPADMNCDELKSQFLACQAPVQDEVEVVEEEEKEVEAQGDLRGDENCESDFVWQEAASVTELYNSLDYNVDDNPFSGISNQLTTSIEIAEVEDVQNSSRRFRTITLKCIQVECGISVPPERLNTHMREAHQVEQFRCVVMLCGESFAHW
jgi:hypothetical protein